MWDQRFAKRLLAEEHQLMSHCVLHRRLNGTSQQAEMFRLGSPATAVNPA